MGALRAKFVGCRGCSVSCIRSFYGVLECLTYLGRGASYASILSVDPSLRMEASRERYADRVVEPPEAVVCAVFSTPDLPRVLGLRSSRVVNQAGRV
jgi:hypothetical protein